MSELFLNWLLLVGIFSMALASPGPDFVVAVRNALVYSRLSGVLTAIGFAAGVAIHVSLALLGIAAIIAKSAFLFSLIKYIGAAYLIYMGVAALRSKGFDAETIKNRNFKKKEKSFNTFKSFMSGFITNLFNPKATLFFLAIFSQFIGPDISIITQISFALTCVVMTFLWFSFVSIILTHPPVRQKFMAATKYIDRACGTLLIGLGFKLALSKIS